ncbi:MAG: dTDP-4-dehydrorhamnose 3,5-epimerase [Candidatus Magasanikbacteria bacterium CG10_big_fil_rev_8_21_14_0_10_42_10]|uniref:dTDP-4-dehydrorhamnose 3,5-epimerase n=1 Tax=Candidatus Magasanikbacteria bacterium CG10_big_fil_rev_8_21_14_0_10_42_10 TaxID=1974649 RepID=A0A2H0TWW2_9BACT|nr:MAG: dTDP-4-dehydrorhamnose 3,5-epimerase [Candidatus Magasanikbacteria bacterium CG10_big_fil_rev_8_21_14_0_10_42_10]
MIQDVVITPLKKIQDERGSIMHMLRNDSPEFDTFGEIYFSTVYPGVIKGWHIHTVMTLQYAVVKGNIKLVLFDGRDNSPTKGEVQEIFIGDKNYCLVKIPPGVVNGFKGIGTEEAIIANCATHPHTKDEIVRVDPFTKEIPYNWDIKYE